MHWGRVSLYRDQLTWEGLLSQWGYFGAEFGSTHINSHFVHASNPGAILLEKLQAL